jgi:Asp/Glu/hydantoin racemase
LQSFSPSPSIGVVSASVSRAVFTALRWRIVTVLARLLLETGDHLVRKKLNIARLVTAHVARCDGFVVQVIQAGALKQAVFGGHGGS